MTNKVRIHITETINHSFVVDLDEYPEEVAQKLEEEDGEFFGDFTSMMTAKDGNYEFDTYDKVVARSTETA